MDSSTLSNVDSAPVRKVKFSDQDLRFIVLSSSNRNSGESLIAYNALDMFGSKGPPRPVYGLYGICADPSPSLLRSPAIAEGVPNRPGGKGSRSETPPLFPVALGVSSLSVVYPDEEDADAGVLFTSGARRTPSKSRSPIVLAKIGGRSDPIRVYQHAW